MRDLFFHPDALTALGLVAGLALLWLAYQLGRWAAERAELRRMLRRPCVRCAGSGRGLLSGGRCGHCRGRGEVVTS